MKTFEPHIPIKIPADIMLLGEASGAEEEKEGQPFVGRSGKFLEDQMDIIGLPRKDLYISNVFWERPPNNNVNYFFANSKDENPKCSDLPAFRGAYLKEEYRCIAKRLQEELEIVEPKFVISLGATPLWALTGREKITLCRGKFIDIDGCLVKYSKAKCLPIFHPAYILRNRSMMELWIEDMKKVLNNGNEKVH